MDFRAVLIYFCLFSVQANCGPVRKKDATSALNTTIQEIRVKIRSVLDHLDVPGVLPNISCLTLNFSELVRPEQQHLTAHRLSSFRSRIAEVSKFTPELSSQLQIICQTMQDVEKLWTNKTDSQTYSPLSLKQDLDGYVYAKCLLELVDKWLGKAKF